MREIDRVADLLMQTYAGDPTGAAWFGPALRPLLGGLSPAAAARRPLPRRHTIWELVLHVTANLDFVLARLDGRELELSPEADWPPTPEPTAAAWSEALAALDARYEALRRGCAPWVTSSWRTRWSGAPTRSTPCCTASSSTTSTTPDRWHSSGRRPPRPERPNGSLHRPSEFAATAPRPHYQAGPPVGSSHSGRPASDAHPAHCADLASKPGARVGPLTDTVSSTV